MFEPFPELKRRSKHRHISVVLTDIQELIKLNYSLFGGNDTGQWTQNTTKHQECLYVPGVKLLIQCETKYLWSILHCNIIAQQHELILAKSKHTIEMEINL